MKTVLVLVSGVVTDRIGGARMSFPLGIERSLISSRGNSLWKYDLHRWIYFGSRRHDGSELSILDFRRSCSSLGGHCNSSCSIQDFLFLVPAEPWVCFDVGS